MTTVLVAYDPDDALAWRHEHNRSSKDTGLKVVSTRWATAPALFCQHARHWRPGDSVRVTERAIEGVGWPGVQELIIVYRRNPPTFNLHAKRYLAEVRRWKRERKQ